MQPTFTVDSREFQRVAEALITTSSRTYPRFVNGQLYRVATLAVKLTDKANRTKIDREMGTLRSVIKTRSSKSGGKNGWVRITKREIKDDSFASRILIARHAATGKWFAKGRTIKEKAATLIAAKIRSVAFIKSGWIPSIQTLTPLVYSRGAALGGAKQVGAPKGYAVPARFTMSGPITGTIANTALLHQSKFNAWHGKLGNPIPIAQKGLQTAMNVATRDMADEFYRRTAIELKPFGATLGP